MDELFGFNDISLLSWADTILYYFTIFYMKFSCCTSWYLKALIMFTVQQLFIKHPMTGSRVQWLRV